MARYNREFLVPYLQDICALYMAKRKLTNHYENLYSKANSASKGKYNPRPEEPTQEDTLSIGRILAFMLGAFLIFAGIGGICGLITENSDAIWLFNISLLEGAFGVWIIIAAIRGMKETKQENQQRQAAYQQKMRQYESVNESNKKAKELIPGFQAQMQKCDAERRKVDALIRKAYSANVIPNQYRNIYAAVYLYDYFSGSREDDLALALNTFVLEQIKERLDILIENQTEILLNQRMMLANQQRSIEQQNEHNRLMREKVDKMQASYEERNQYLGMIECNTAATAYFAAADYIRRI